MITTPRMTRSINVQIARMVEWAEAEGIEVEGKLVLAYHLILERERGEKSPWHRWPHSPHPLAPLTALTPSSMVATPLHDITSAHAGEGVSRDSAQVHLQPP